MQLDNIPVVRSAMFAQFPRLIHGMSMTQGAVEPDAAFAFNPDVRAIGRDPFATDHVTRFLARFGLRPTQLAVMQQVHGSAIHHITTAGMYAETDGLVTTQPLLALGVRVADCVPALFFAPAEDVIAVAHAGWRGAAEHICAQTAAAMMERHRLDPADVLVWLGPSAGPCCYEVGAEVAAMFPEHCLRRDGGGAPRLDLREACRTELRDMGIPDGNIESSDLCTIDRPAFFHSWRRDGAAAGRMMAIIALREQIEN